jgi:hypothetical protein
MVETAAHLGAIAFIHRLGSSLNGHIHFHVCVVDGVFEEVAGIVFHPASAIDEAAVAQAQTDLRWSAYCGVAPAHPLLVNACAKRALRWCAAGPCHLTHARTRATQTFTGALPVGRADSAHLRGFSAAVPEVRCADAPDRVHYRGHADQKDP